MIDLRRWRWHRVQANWVEVRAKSKLIMLPGMPMAMATNSHASSQNGGSGTASTTAQSTTMCHAIARMTDDLRIGKRDASMPSTGPQMPPAMMMPVKMRLVCSRVNPSPASAPAAPT